MNFKDGGGHRYDKPQKSSKDEVNGFEDFSMIPQNY